MCARRAEQLRVMGINGGGAQKGLARAQERKREKWLLRSIIFLKNYRWL